MKFEEVLPALRNGKKIRCESWEPNQYTCLNDEDCFSIDDILNNDWEIIDEPKYDWDYIIKNKCPCWFWDNDEENKVLCILNSIEADIEFPYKDCITTTGWKHCRPVRKDELNFYEDKEDEDNS